MRDLAEKVIACCRELAKFTEEPGRTTRTFLSPPMHDVHRVLGDWMRSLGMHVSIDAVGNLRSAWLQPCAARLLIGSHLDTVPNAGAFDGILGVVLGIALVEALGGRNLPFSIEVIGFSEEEGIRFDIPFIGSRAVVGDINFLNPEISAAIKEFGINPMPHTRFDPNAVAYLEFHIEQGPILESLNQPLAVVDGIVGQSRLLFIFEGQANHAGTTPMALRRDALTAAAEWITFVEKTAHETPGLVSTTGQIEAEPNAVNVVPGRVRLSLDTRHASDATRRATVDGLIQAAKAISNRRGIRLWYEAMLDQPAVRMDPELVAMFGPIPHLTSGAGHDAMILAPHVSSVMLFLRSPGGISHHPDESVLVEDVEAALQAGLGFIDELAVRHS